MPVFFYDLVSLALDALNGEREVAETTTDQIEFLEKNLVDLVDLLTVLNEQMDRNFAIERERLKSLYLLLEARLKEHDSAEKVVSRI